MATRFSRLQLGALLALAPLTLIGCGQDAPTAGGTVQLAVIAGSGHGGRPFSTEMTQEVTTQPLWAGDPDGAGVALVTVNPGQGEVCWELSVSNILLPATASHIHQASESIRGPIVVGLSAPDETGTAVGCRSGIDPDLLREILVNPEAFYVNVHTHEYPAGAVRGQLDR